MTAPIPPAPAPLDRTKLLAARFRAARDRPYFATALCSLTVVESTDVPAMAVDRWWRCYVAPAFVRERSVEALAAVWIHEVAHLVRDHHGRAERLPPEEARLHRRVNIAEDMEINDDLVADGLALPADAFVPATFGLPKGLLFEEYLRRLPKPRELPACECGSGAHGVPMPWDLPPGRGDHPVVQPTEAEAIRRQVADAIRQHVRQRGTVAAGWQRWADGVLEPQVDWRRLLAGAVREAVAWASGAADYTYARPSRRGRVLPRVVLPSLRKPIPRAAVVIDTSASMGEPQLAAALGEVAGVLRSVGLGGNRVNVIACDAAVHVARRAATVADVELRGGGGTDMRVGIARALEGPHPPQVVVVLTDGETPWPAEAPRCRIIAGLIGERAPAPPPFVEAIRIRPLDGRGTGPRQR